MNFLEGEILYFNKPLHWTSFNLVKRIRAKIIYKLKIKKIKVKKLEEDFDVGKSFLNETSKLFTQNYD